MNGFIVMVSAASMPTTCWGVYKRVAVVEVDDVNKMPAMISERARGLRRIVQTWERVSWRGGTPRSVSYKTLVEAYKLADELNAERGVPAQYSNAIALLSGEVAA